MSYRQPFVGEYPITQRYGEIVPGVTYKNRPHTGIDYGCPEGTEILASEAGVVMLAEMDTTGYGFTVIIQHNDGKATLYAHLSMISVVLRQKVQQGQVIALSGSTGNCTGPHLHFEARKHWSDYRSHFNPMELPLMSVDDSVVVSKPENVNLKGADSFRKGDFLRVVCRDGVKAFYTGMFDSFTQYTKNTPFVFTGKTTVNPKNGLTYMQVIPASFTLWVAANNGDVQMLDKVEE